MRRFQLKRTRDPSGVSGLGYVAEGVVFSGKHVAVAWLAAPKGYNVPHIPKGVAVYESIDHMLAVHGHGGDTVVEWMDYAPKE